MNLEELSANLGLEKDEYLELLEIMVDSGSQDMERLKQAVDSGNAEEAAKAAHSLKGAAANLGLMELSSVAKEMEEKAKAGEIQELSARLQVLADKLHEVSSLVG